MFCALKGKTRKPRFFNNRQNPAAKTLLPTPEPVPWNIKMLGIFAAQLLHPLWNRQTFFPQKYRIEKLGLVTDTGISKNGNNRFSRTKFLCQANCSCNVDSGRCSKTKSFFFQKIKANRQSFFIRDLKRLVNWSIFQIW